MERKPTPPGIHGQGRFKQSEYGMQLREKQKVRRIYGVLEKQFRTYFKMADRKKGVTGEHLLSFLERRLDNVIYRMGFSRSRDEARQMVTHGHFQVNARKVRTPSFLVKVGDEVVLKEKSRKMDRVLDAIETVKRREIPEWLEPDLPNFKGTVTEFPRRENITMEIQEKLIVELYSK